MRAVLLPSPCRIPRAAGGAIARLQLHHRVLAARPHLGIPHASPEAPEPGVQEDEGDDKKQSGTDAEAGPAVVIAGGATIAGALPDVLCATFLDTFPTLSRSRKGGMN